MYIYVYELCHIIYALIFDLLRANVLQFLIRSMAFQGPWASIIYIYMCIYIYVYDQLIRTNTN